MMVAGIPLRDENVLQLARLLYDAGFDSTAQALVAGSVESGLRFASRCRSESAASTRSLQNRF